jgi:hypothetical protein
MVRRWVFNPAEENMRKLQISAILIGALLVAPFEAAFAQTQVAYAKDSSARYVTSPRYVIFFDRNAGQLSSVADETVRLAAADPDRPAGFLRVVGRADYATTVKYELMRHGVPTHAIVVTPAVGTMPEGTSEPSTVEIQY